MPDVYEGDRPYIFACYAHADRDAALPMIGALVAAGYRVWWDEGIELATRYPRRIADHVYGCTCFVMFVSRASLGSRWCADETHYAIDLNKTVVPVYLEDVELTRDLQMRMGYIQSLFRHDFASDEALCKRLCQENTLECCLTDEGRRRRGAKPRDGGSGSGGPSQSNARVVVAGGAGNASGVTRRDKLADYSWAELKELSRMIAAAGSDKVGLDIAREYCLVDKDGKLQGDEKPLQLKDGTKTSVRILGFRHDDLATGGKAGISFEFSDAPMTHRMNPTGTNKGGWKECEMRGWLNREFLALLPDDLRKGVAEGKGVAEARKRTNNGGYVRRENDASVVTETADRLWLLSVSEVYGKLSAQSKNVPYSPATYDAEGAQYQLYADRGVSISSYAFCAKRGADSWWWLRSPNAVDSYGFLDVSYVGDWYWNRAYDGWGVSPGFCF